MQNKRGQGLSTNAIILIILGVVILVVLILGFTMGWKTILPWIGGDNVETIVNQCTAACATSSVYDFCTKKRTLKADELPEDAKEKEETCNYFSSSDQVADYGKYGIAACPGLCEESAAIKSCNAKDAENQNTCAASTTDSDCTANDLCEWK